MAIKYIDLSEYMKKANKIEEIYKEAKILMNLAHKNIIKLHFAFVLKTDICLVMEYADGGELIEFVHEKGGLSEVEARDITRQICHAMKLCHA